MSILKSWLTDTLEVSRKSYSDEFGTEPFTIVGTIPGLIQPVSGRFSQRSGKESGEASYMLYAELSAEIDAGDRITDAYGRVFIAQFIQPEGISARLDHQEIPLELTT